MTVKALMPVRHVNLVAPLAHEATDRHITDTAASVRAASGAAIDLIGASLRIDGLESAATTLPTPGFATSATAARTATSRATSARRLPSADSNLFSLLVEAYLDCRRTKRNSASALAFEAHLESNLCDLHDDLVSGAYRPGRSICFVTLRPKPREIWAAGFRDRVVHHLLHNRISPTFYRSFTADTCACIPGRGTLYAAKRLEAQVLSLTENWSRPAFYLKCDLSNFFVAIDKHVLREQLVPRIDGAWWQRLAETVLFHDPRGDVEVRSPAAVMRLVPAHKSLFNAPADTGLPIGNLSSQFFANVYLDALDQFAKHQLRAPRYVRYVDDFVFTHESTDVLAGWLRQVDAEGKTVEQKAAEVKGATQKGDDWPFPRGGDGSGPKAKSVPQDATSAVLADVKKNGPGHSANPKPKAPAKTKRAAPIKLANPPAKYRSLDGQTWTGRGLKPLWLVKALDGGAKLADFELKAH